MRVERAFTPASREFQAVLQLDESEMQHPWSALQWSQLDDKHDVVFLLHEGDALVGFALYRLSPLEELAHLLKVVVTPAKRGSGLALEFFGDQEAWLRSEQIKRIYLEVAASNERALGLYRKLGFLKLRRIPHFYHDGQDAWTMEKALASSI